MRLQVGVLGPLVVSLDGHTVPLWSPKLRTFLAVLALSAGEPVLYDRLATAVWGDDQPKDARRALQLHVTRLRQLLGGEQIRTVPGGYVLATKPELVDAVRFGRLLDAAARAEDPTVERAALVEALALWRGEPFDGVQSAWLEGVQAPYLSARRLAALERRIELDLAARRTDGLVAEIEELTAGYPLREQYWGHLMTALAHAGRRAEALEAYQRLYRLLAAELGIEPSRPLRELHRRILDGEGDPRLPAPRQLPATVSHFIGRAGALARLDASLPASGDAAPVTVAITGVAGAGKTALAVRWAHRVIGHFPDGQLYVNLRGSDPLPPAEAIRRCLEPLGVAAHRIPVDLDARAGLYRTLMAGKRILLVLDDAHDSHQIRPLLPGAGGCMVVVTSRDSLADLVAYDGARPLELDVLTPQEAVRLLTVRLGPQRVTAEPEAVRAIVARCGMHPPALNAVAAQAVLHPALPLAALAGHAARIAVR
ncbi:NB-ARC domain-containing protein [Actinoplanes sp. NBC_00393]|uniref:AfsR/SARP family transcriptional regulator n=1 Tax=Actinoplanes sp. NBC_00393 TaxID=2975953 RepID=UPI002E1AC85D